MPLCTSNDPPDSTVCPRWFLRSTIPSPTTNGRVGELHLVAEIELAQFSQSFPGQSVEEPCLGARPRQEEALAIAPRGNPVGHGDRMQVGRSVGYDHSAVIAVGGECGRDVPVAKLVEGCLLPGLLLTSVHMEPDHPIAEHVDGCSERPSCCDLGQLMVVTDQDDLGPGLSRLADHLCEVTGARHAGFVDDDDGSAVDRALLDEVASDRRGVDPSSRLELSCGSCRRGETDDRPTRLLVRGSNGSECVRLAGASASDEECNTVT